jgi:hypothetical protein
VIVFSTDLDHQGHRRSSLNVDVEPRPIGENPTLWVVSIDRLKLVSLLSPHLPVVQPVDVSTSIAVELAVDSGLAHDLVRAVRGHILDTDQTYTQCQVSSLGFRDPDFLNFLGLTSTYFEKDVEQAILRELEAFILEKGSDFAFVARQSRNDRGWRRLPQEL